MEKNKWLADIPIKASIVIGNIKIEPYAKNNDGAYKICLVFLLKKEAVLNLLIQTATLDADSILGLLDHIKKDKENGIKNAFDTVSHSGNFISQMDTGLVKDFFDKIGYTKEIKKQIPIMKN